jgi:predicted nuclease of predicted toxin-antitoxin system
MKLLLDANISWRLCASLSEHFGVCDHVNRTVLNPPAKDSEIWRYAQQNSYTIVAHDSDFLNLLEVYGYPPRVILLKTGNIDSKKTLWVLLEAKQSIVDLHQKDYGLLEIMKGNPYER